MYVNVNSGWISELSLAAQIEMYSDPKNTLALFVFGYKQSAVAYNSENMWLPIGEKRNVCGKYVGKAISANISIKFKIIGYRWQILSCVKFFDFFSLFNENELCLLHLKELQDVIMAILVNIICTIVKLITSWSTSARLSKEL